MTANAELLLFFCGIVVGAVLVWSIWLFVAISRLEKDED